MQPEELESLASLRPNFLPRARQGEMAPMENQKSAKRNIQIDLRHNFLNDTLLKVNPFELREDLFCGRDSRERWKLVDNILHGGSIRGVRHNTHINLVISARHPLCIPR